MSETDHQLVLERDRANRWEKRYEGLQRERDATLRATHRLNMIVQSLCPDGWVFQVLACSGSNDDLLYIAVVSNGDDNVLCKAESEAEALADLIARLLHGRVRPLTGNTHGRYIRPDYEET